MFGLVPNIQGYSHHRIQLLWMLGINPSMTDMYLMHVPSYKPKPSLSCRCYLSFS